MGTWAEKRAFREVPETCPVVDRALDRLVSAVLDEFEEAVRDELSDDDVGVVDRARKKAERWSAQRRDEAEKAIKDQTTALRQALVNAIEAQADTEPTP